MEEAEAHAMRREILEDVGHLLREELAADAWGRLLVHVVRGPDGQPAVAGIDVEEVLGDEARVDALFGGDAVRALLPTLGKAVEALCALDGLELDDVGGGTFVRVDDARFAWLPALVRAPSLRFDRDRDALLAKLRAQNDRLAERYAFPHGGKLAVDLAREIVAFSSTGRPAFQARGTLVGTFAPQTRSWGWASSNPHAPDAVRRASAALIDALPDRDFWELSTPTFATDEPTAWAIAALVCDRGAGDGVLCAPEPEGLVFVLLRELVAV